MRSKIPDELTSSDALKRKEAWQSLATRKLSWSDAWNDLCGILRRESDSQVRAQGLISLLEIQPWLSERSATWSFNHGWLFLPFSVNADGAGRSAVLCICDQQHIRDVQSLVKLSRFLSQTNYPGTAFYHVPLINPNWERIGPHNLNAICFLGRPGMFRDSQIVQHWEEQRRDRIFSFPALTGAPGATTVTERSAETFHNVRQQRPTAGPFLHKANDSNYRRTDYAIVQRFQINYAGKPLTVVLLAGATSLGTFGATEWVSSHSFNQVMANALEAVGKNLGDSTDCEVLLRVAARKENPPEPWTVETCEPQKLFIDGSMNALCAPRTIAPGMDGPNIACILFDEDEVRFGTRAQNALVAICNAAMRLGNNVIPIEKLVTDSSFWPGNNITAPTDIEKAKEFFSSNLRKHRLRQALSIEGGSLSLNCTLIPFQLKAPVPSGGLQRRSAGSRSAAT